MNASAHFFRRGFVARALGLFLFLTFSFLGSVAVPGSPAARAQLETLGYRTYSFGSTYAPTAAENQSKLWFNDGLWWGSLYNDASGQYEIYRFDWTTHNWITTGTAIDTRKVTRADCLWDGEHLYIVSAVRAGSVISNKLIHILRYSYDGSKKSYSVDPGFPVYLSNTATIGAVIDKDTTGTLWITYTAENGLGGSSVYIAHSNSDGTQWTLPYVLPAAGTGNLFAEDISSLVAFKDHIGVMWSNQNEHTMYFAEHRDGEPDNVWIATPALQGDLLADNHINLKTVQVGDHSRVFAAVKTSLNDADAANKDAPLLVLLERMPNGSWSKHTFGKVSERHTRPLLLIDSGTQTLYLFATSFCCGGGAIYYKKANLNSEPIQFPEGLGAPFILLGSESDINNATSTKQSLDGTATGMLVLAEDSVNSYYVHNMQGIQVGPPVTDGPPGVEPAVKLMIPFVFNQH